MLKSNSFYILIIVVLFPMKAMAIGGKGDIPSWLGYLVVIFLIILSFFSIFGLFKKSFRKKLDLICPEYEDIFEVDKTKQDVTCNKCSVKLVPLEGFYNKNTCIDGLLTFKQAEKKILESFKKINK